MTQTVTAAKVRWCTAAIVLAVGSGLASSWRPAPGASPTFGSRVVRFVPEIFTVGAGQALPTKVCTKKPVTGEKMIFTLNSSSATTTASVVHPITSTPTGLNFAGQTGPAGVFAANIPLPLGSYSGVTLAMSATMIVSGVVTCDVDGAGPIPTRTYYTNGNADVTAPDLFVMNPADATPVDTAVTSGGGDIEFTMPVPFSVIAGVNTTLNILYETDVGFGLWDISPITGIPETYKIVPNDMSILAALPDGPP